MQASAKATAFFVGVASNKYQLPMMLSALLILIGTSVLLPVAQKFGVNPVHVGIIFLINSGISNRSKNPE